MNPTGHRAPCLFPANGSTVLVDGQRRVVRMTLVGTVQNPATHKIVFNDGGTVEW